MEGVEHGGGEVGAEVDEHRAAAGEMRGGEEETCAVEGVQAAAAGDVGLGGEGRGVVDLVCGV